ncbi:hypothetical protein FACS1894166_12230 [Bacilli bacterium]|nr:hypothetical protein FACS1894166_12230 [Bacilli bacterium]
MKKHLSIGDCFEITKQGTATFSLEKYHNSIFYHLFASIPISKANQTYDSQYEFFIPEGVKTLSKAAFQLPHLFGEITLPSSLKTIGSDFFNNANVTKVTLQNDCVLNSNSFNGATDLSKFETNVYKINLKGPNHFLSTSISHINLDGIFLSPNPNDNKRSFSNTKLTHVTIPHH